MRILGIGYGVHDTGAALLDGGEVLGAINEERLTREKRESRFPASSVNHVLTEYPGDIDQIAVAGAGYGGPYVRRNVRRTLKESGWDRGKGSVDALIKSVYNGLVQPSTFLEEVIGHLQEQTRIAADEAALRRRTSFVEHHHAHAASAYYTSGFDEATVLTCDGAGDNLSSTVYRGFDGELERVSQNDDVDSVGKLWAQVPTVFGFKGAKHAGKFMGLAPYASGVPSGLETELEWILDVDGTTLINRFERAHGSKSYEGKVLELKNRLGEYSAEEVALALQNRTEEVLSEFGRAAVVETGCENLAVAGGVFANVKVNQKLYEIDGVDRLFVHQNMGDGGLGLGAALDKMADNDESFQPFTLDTVYLGPSYGQESISTALDRIKIPDSLVIRTFDDSDDLADVVAESLSEGAVVSLCSGRMEYGPRALGNRSILYQPTDPTAIEWLNERLDRTEFMPFAPVTLAEHAAECYVDYDTDKCPAADFMTVTFECTEEMQKRSPGVVHVDGTARPQIVREEQNPLYYQILDAYERKTGIPSLINTSFNRHGEPIVCKPAEAVRSFVNSNMDLLIAGRLVVTDEANFSGKELDLTNKRKNV